jgi:hypothetical protein
MLQAFNYWLDNMGDPAAAAWACTMIHIVAGLCSCRQALRSEARSPERTLWASIGILLLSIGLNKQLDLQILVVGELRALFGQSPFWGIRRLVAAVVLTVCGVAVIGRLGALGWTVRGRAWTLDAAAGAAAALAALVLARGTTSMVNDMLAADLHGAVGDLSHVRVKDVLELLTASVIVLGCLARQSLETETAER